MKKKKFLRFWKRVLVLLLCVTLSAGCFNNAKLRAHATLSLGALGAYSLYEICLFLGCMVVSGIGVGCVMDNKDNIARIGKDFVDWADLDDMSGWAFSSVDIYGNSYVYGTEALQEIQDTSWTVIQGGGQSPKNDDDKDGDGDKDADDRALELDEINFTATAGCMEWLGVQIGVLAGKIIAGDLEDNPLAEHIDLAALENYYYEDDYGPNANGVYEITGKVIDSDCMPNQVITFTYSGTYSSFPVAYIRDNYGYFGYYNASKNAVYTFDVSCKGYNSNGVNLSDWNHRGRSSFFIDEEYFFNIPIFASQTDALSFYQTGDESGILNKKPKVYRIADWLQENWEGAIETLNNGMHSLNDNALIVGEAANQAMLNQVNGLGYIELLHQLLAVIQALTLPDAVTDPVTYPATSTVPLPDDLPWADLLPNPDPIPDDDSGNGSQDGSDELDIPEDPSGLTTLFGILIILILIIIMLLMIFISCLAFIIMIFRIKATTGFLPPDMVSGLDYLKTLEIPGFGMSVYDFFMSLIYIILIFSIIGYLRKNIDKIKFPRKG